MSAPTGPRFSQIVSVSSHSIPFDFDTRCSPYMRADVRRTGARHERCARPNCTIREPDPHVGNIVNVHARRRLEPRRNRHRRLAAQQPIHQIKDVPSMIDQDASARRRRRPPLASRFLPRPAGSVRRRSIDMNRIAPSLPASIAWRAVAYAGAYFQLCTHIRTRRFCNAQAPPAHRTRQRESASGFSTSTCAPAPNAARAAS